MLVVVKPETMWNSDAYLLIGGHSVWPGVALSTSAT